MQNSIVLVGRPNVGKSTLFNRFSIRKKALIHNQPGVTRDRQYSEAQLGPLNFIIVDTPGLEQIRNPGELESGMLTQALAAIKTAHIVCLIVDYRSGITPDDFFFAD